MASLDEGFNTIGIMCNLTKAFDFVYVKLLASKLEYYRSQVVHDLELLLTDRGVLKSSVLKLVISSLNYYVAIIKLQ